MTWTDQTEFEASALQSAADEADHQRHRRAAARLAATENLLREVRGEWYDTLPELTDGLTCSRCGAGAEWRDLQIVEEGYQRWTSCAIDDETDTPRLLAQTDGWDDMSEGGEIEYVLCNGCGAHHKMPAEMEWC